MRAGLLALAPSAFQVLLCGVFVILVHGGGRLAVLQRWPCCSALLQLLAVVVQASHGVATGEYDQVVACAAPMLLCC